MTNTVKNLIKNYSYEIEENNYYNVIAETAKNGFDYIAELRNIFKNAQIDITIFDEQLTKMLVSYNEIAKILNSIKEKVL